MSDQRVEATLDKTKQAGDRNEGSIELHERERQIGGTGVIHLPANAIIDTRNEPLISTLACAMVTRAI